MAEKFFFETFTNLMTISPKKALEYRDRCSQAKETPTELKGDWLEIKVDDFTEDEVEFTRADLIEKLNNAWVKFTWNSKDETLLQKCITNNLI